MTELQRAKLLEALLMIDGAIACQSEPVAVRVQLDIAKRFIDEVLES